MRFWIFNCYSSPAGSRVLFAEASREWFKDELVALQRDQFVLHLHENWGKRI